MERYDFQNLDKITQKIVCLQLSEAEAMLKPKVEAGDSPEEMVLWSEVAYLRAVITEDPRDIKEALSRLAEAETLCSSQCQCDTQGLVGPAMRALRWRLHSDPSTNRAAVSHFGFENCTLLAYVLMMQALVMFRTGQTTSYVTGAVKLKASWKLYKQLQEESERRHSKGSGEGGAALGGGGGGGSSGRLAGAVGSGSGRLASAGASAGSALRSFFGKTGSPAKGPVAEVPPVSEAMQGDVDYGVGGFLFFISMIPNNFKWIVEAVGFRGDREAGRQKLASAALSPGPRAYAAHLLWLWAETFFYKDRVKAEEILAQASQRYQTEDGSESPLFLFLGGYLARVQGHMEVAMDRFEKARQAGYQIRHLQLLSLYEVGWCFFLRCEWGAAVERLEPFLLEFRSPSCRAWATYQLGVCYYLLGQPEAALGYMKMVPSSARRHYSFDQVALRKSRQYIREGGLNEFEKQQLITANRMEIKDFKGAAEACITLRAAMVKSRGPQPALPPASSGNEDKNVFEETSTSFRESTSTEGGAGQPGARGNGGVAGVNGGLAKEGAGGKDEVDERIISQLSAETMEATDPCSAVYLYSVGKALRGLGRDGEAKKFFQRVVAGGAAAAGEDVWVVPHALTELGELFIRAGGPYSEAEKLLRVAKKKFHSYDYDKPLIRRIQFALDQCKLQSHRKAQGNVDSDDDVS